MSDKSTGAVSDVVSAEKPAAGSDKSNKIKKFPKPGPNLKLLLGANDIPSASRDLQARAAPVPAPSSPTPHVEPSPRKEIARRVEVKPSAQGRFKLRHIVIAGTFALFVLIPTVLTTLYMTMIAADQYQSTASFSVRSIDGGATSDILGLFGQSAGSSTSADSFILIDYIKSPEMLNAVEKNFDLNKVFGRRGMDFFYSLRPDEYVEDRLSYWQSMVDVTYDHASGIMTLSLKAFDPADAQRLTKFIIDRSEQLVNALSTKATDEVLRGARTELQVAEARLTKARTSVRDYRDSSQEVDPSEGARLAQQLISGMESRLAELNTSLTTARMQMSDDSPRIKALLPQIESLKQQIREQREKLGSGSASQKTDRTNDVAGRIEQYQGLATEQEFAERAYTGAMAAMEKARIEATGKQRYLATFIQPTLSEDAQFPQRLLNSFVVFFACLFLWGVSVMIFYNIRDRA